MAIPNLIVWANPKGKAAITLVKRMSKRVFEVAYRHEEDNEDYKHDFAPGIEMYAVKLDTGATAILIVGAKGQKVFDDFKRDR